jgi:hypothetical protein
MEQQMLFRNHRNSQRKILTEALDKANQLSHEFDSIGAEIIRVSQFSIIDDLNRFGKEEHLKFVNEVSEKHPLEKSLAEQQTIQTEYLEKKDDISFRMMTHARDLNFVYLMNLHEKLCSTIELMQYKLIELMELKTAARERKTVKRRGDFVENIRVLSDDNIIGAFSKLKEVMEEFKNLAERISSSQMMAFLFENEAHHEDAALAVFVTNFILKTKACHHVNTETYLSFKAFAESVIGIDLFKILREYVATHAHERLLSIELLKKVNPLCDQITAHQNEGIAFAKEAVDRTEKARTDDVNYFMNKKIVLPRNPREIFASSGLAGMFPDKNAVSQLFKLAEKDKHLRVAIASEIIKGIADKQPHLLIDIMQDNQLALQFEKLSLKNRNIKKLIDGYSQLGDVARPQLK